MALCQECHGDSGWFWDRVTATRVAMKQAFTYLRPLTWVSCGSCIGGVSSCCDGEVGSSGEIGNNTLATAHWPT